MARTQTVRHGQGKHRTVGQHEETPGFKAKRVKARKTAKLRRKAKQRQRRGS